ncbi:hypothetical protein [Helicobacter sp. T3_23-1056]
MFWKFVSGFLSVDFASGFFVGGFCGFVAQKKQTKNKQNLFKRILFCRFCLIKSQNLPQIINKIYPKQTKYPKKYRGKNN